MGKKTRKKTIFILAPCLLVLIAFFIFWKRGNQPAPRHLTTDSLSSLSDVATSEAVDTPARVELAKEPKSDDKPDLSHEKQKKQEKPRVDSSTRQTKTDSAALWPVDSPPLLKGALLPAHRIIAFYGNLYSKRMGILGEYAPDVVLAKLTKRVQEWQRADSSKKVIPALELIATSGQNLPGRNGLYRMRMPDWMLDSVIHLARSIDALFILDIQVGKSTVQKEVPYFEKYLKLPDVGLAIDPEFSMKRGNVPGTRIGTMDAKDIQYCVDYLTKLVRKNDLPPKVLVVHRFTQGMVTHYKKIKLNSEVQIIMDMDGFGAKVLKKDAYHQYIYKEPVEYTGIKLFLKNDNSHGHKMMTPKEVLALHPQPVYVQYQ